MTCNKATSKLVHLFLEALDTPRALAVWLMFKNNEHVSMLQLDIDPLNYVDSGLFRLDYLATKFLSKANFLSTNIDLKAVALEGFRKAEEVCGEINVDSFGTASVSKRHKRFEYLHNAAVRKIDRILTDYSGDELFEASNWGPGVTLNRNVKRDTSSTNKFRHEDGITRDLFDLLGGMLATAYPTWDLSKLKFHEGNKVVTVPKNSKTDRTIAIEPGLNLWFQKGVGNMIRRRLSRVGLDLSSQKRNQDLALAGSNTGKLATVDFSNASDSISRATVEALLPPRWFSLMDSLRSWYGSIEGHQAKYEKFSSMGNGFTFELETLIFYAIALAVCQYLHLSTADVSVYGDDVIIPVEAFDLFVEVSKNYGFHVNIQKSYSTGCFRESCGSHYFSGRDCKPYFLRKVVEGELDVYLAANSIRRLSHSSQLEFCDQRFESCWKYLVSRVKYPCLISDGYGDGGFISNFDEAVPSRARHGIEGYFCKARITVPLGYISDDHALLLARLKGRSIEMSYGNVTHLRSRSRNLRKRILIRQWANLGPWL